MLGGKLRRDCDGSSLVEFTVIFPVFALLALGGVDLAYLFYEYNLANKATYTGAHTAIVSDPVAEEVTSPTWVASKIGTDCSNAGGPTGNCDAYVTTTLCTADNSQCTNNYSFDDTAFQAILTDMQSSYQCADAVTCPLQRQNVTISYSIRGTLGFVGQPNGLPMDVTVRIRCMNHTFYFIGALMGWAFSQPQGCIGTASGWSIPSYSTTLTSEDMVTN
jgi:Flp pilus assembly protein TadG